MGNRAKIEYISTGVNTAIVKINDVETRVTSFRFEHDVQVFPVATIEFVDPEVHITSLDSMLIRKEVDDD